MIIDMEFIQITTIYANCFYIIKTLFNSDVSNR
jgi:hypothetical protein